MIVQKVMYLSEAGFGNYFKQVFKRIIRITGLNIMHWESKYSPSENLFPLFQIIIMVCKNTNDLIISKSNFNLRKLTGRWFSAGAASPNHNPFNLLIVAFRTSIALSSISFRRASTSGHQPQGHQDTLIVQLQN